MSRRVCKWVRWEFYTASGKVGGLLVEKWPHKSAQPYKWITCSHMRHDLSSKHEQHNEHKTQKKPYGSLQGKGRIRDSPVGVDPYRACPAV